MLRGTYGEATGRRLFAAAADLTRLAGWTSYDIAAHGLAQRYFVQALRLAQAAGDRAYGSLRPGHHEPAGRLPRARPGGGAAGAGRPAGRRLRRRRPSCRPCCTPSRRAGTACSARCGRARPRWCGPSGRWRAARPGDDVPHWARFFDEAQLADEFGHCHRDLQQYRRGRAARGALAPAARPGVRPQPALLPGGAGLRPARARRAGPGVRAGRGGGAAGVGDAVGAGGGVRTGLRAAAGAVPGRGGGTGLSRPGRGAGLNRGSPELRRLEPRPALQWAGRGPRRRAASSHRPGPVRRGSSPQAALGRRPETASAGASRARWRPRSRRIACRGPAARVQGALDRAGVAVVAADVQARPAAAPGGAGRAVGASRVPPPGSWWTASSSQSSVGVPYSGPGAAGPPRSRSRRRGARAPSRRSGPGPPGRATGRPRSSPPCARPGRRGRRPAAAPGRSSGGSGAVWCRTVTGWKAGTRRPGSSSAAARAPVASSTARQPSSPCSSVRDRR